MRISDWSSDVCSSDLPLHAGELLLDAGRAHLASQRLDPRADVERLHGPKGRDPARRYPGQEVASRARIGAARMRVADGDGEKLREPQPRAVVGRRDQRRQGQRGRGKGGELSHYKTDEHTSELQSLMRISYAVFCLNKKKKQTTTKHKVIGYNMIHRIK